ncbi:Galactokinase [Halotydeus destructor]|nr:Galactokinase [Halotydeus destructor]
MDEKIAKLVALASQHYEEKWGEKPVASSYGPGRVNLIGEHTDYNDGLVLPMAISAFTVMVGGLSSSNECHVDTLQTEVIGCKDASFQLEALEPGVPAWCNYVKGVVSTFPQEVKPFNAVIVSSVPLGSGLSSSAALEVSTFLLLEALFGSTNLSLSDKAKLCQKAEHTFAGTPCGIMDQLISLSGKQDNALLIDCRSFETELVPVLNNEYVFVVTNSNVKHDLGTSEYASRRKACEQVASMLGRHSLRDVSMRELETSKNVLSDELYKIARHVVTEIERTADATEALKRNDLTIFGALMSQSHVSLRDDYRVSCTELDSLVEIALESEGVLGSRMTGGGFGGCTVTLVSEDKVDTLTKNINEKYKGDAVSYVFRPSNGGQVLQSAIA